MGESATTVLSAITFCVTSGRFRTVPCIVVVILPGSLDVTLQEVPELFS